MRHASAHLQFGKDCPAVLHDAADLVQQVLAQLHNLLDLACAQTHALLQIHSSLSRHDS
jgi:hypothetical protein